MEFANAVEAVQDGRIFIELLNGPFLYEFKGSPAEYGAGLKLAIDRGWLWKHESGTYVVKGKPRRGLPWMRTNRDAYESLTKASIPA
jgi:hypothetical protein